MGHEHATAGADGTVGTEPAPAPGPDALLQRVLDEIAALRTQLADLDRRLQAEQARAEAREQVIAHQRDELDALRDERRGRHLRPLVVGLAKLRSELLAEDTDTAVHYADTVATLLEGCGCEPVAVAVGDVFDPAAQRVRRAVACGPDQHGRVLEVTAEGWLERDGGRVLAPAAVVVGRHTPADQDEETGHPEEAHHA